MHAHLWVIEMVFVEIGKLVFVFLEHDFITWVLRVQDDRQVLVVEGKVVQLQLHLEDTCDNIEYQVTLPHTP